MSEVENEGEDKEVEIKKKEVLGVERTQLIYTPDSGNYRQERRTKKLNHTTVVEQAAHF